MEQLMAVILAAGEGKRMKSKKSKVVHEACGKALIEWVYTSVDNSGIKDCIVVVGHRADQVKERMGDRVKYVTQERQLGTGHAVMQAEEFLKGKDGYVMVLYGDAPLITPGTIKSTIELHKNNGNSVTIITADMDDPTGYGRIIRDGQGNFIKIIEEKDTNPEEKKIKEINSGLYCFNIDVLLESLKELNNNNKQGEYYLTDTPEIIKNKGKQVGIIKIADPNEVIGINDRIQLFEASEILKKRILERQMRSGVTIIDPKSTYISNDAVIGMDTVIYPGTIIEGTTVIGEDCVIGPNSRIVDSRIADRTEINCSIILKSSVGENTHIGPYAYVRPESVIGSEVKIGDFVEVKKSVIGDKTKISHLTYVGDAEVGSNVNLGCGVVTVNYDGVKKHKTHIGNNSFVGCNVNLVAPVTVNDNAYIAAGSTITEEVPESALAIARERQVIKEGWVTRRRIKK